MADILPNVSGGEGDGPEPRLEVAVVGGGIVGVVTALGLLHREMQVTVYERAAQINEIGAGIAFTGVARECLQRLNPRLLEILSEVGRRSPRETIRYWDGFHPRTKEAAEREESSLLFEVPEGDLAFWACLRSHLLLGMAAQLPEGTVQFGKQLVNYVDVQGSDRVALAFADGSTAEADVVIGCDGIHSATRKLLLGADHPATKPSYSHKKFFRAIVPFPGAVAALGPDKAHDYCIHLGPDAHMISFPVNNAAMYNIFLAIHDPDDWLDPHAMVAPSTRAEASAALRDWGPHVAEIVNLLPEQLPKYGVFDMAENPAPAYACGRVCIAGDAAHASSPFHGAGAGMGVEDALVLAELLAQVQNLPVAVRLRALPAALEAFSAVRRERSQWLVQSSRDMGDILQWRYPATARDSRKIKAEFQRRARKIWDFDVNGMVVEAKTEYRRRVGSLLQGHRTTN
ncbi:uncharacterized protein B0T15DRAFT_437576 [Chaetomium strumarium]|uniref:FAD-binding domain-containing protein n=1 Tax=Chaetomium strumarium TaxID=1170767 RepID=A0AAJ0M0V7_9PEZI|nr:hypothetical protein B0T15DRAFT_437576 [Chaetomium strumarium]